jgi:hypothetical protein
MRRTHASTSATTSRVGFGFLGSFESITSIEQVIGPVLEWGKKCVSSLVGTAINTNKVDYAPPIPIKNPLMITNILHMLADSKPNETQ